MTIYLPPDIEISIGAVVNFNRYATVDYGTAEAASLLVQRLEQEQAQELESPGDPSPRKESGTGPDGCVTSGHVRYWNTIAGTHNVAKRFHSTAEDPRCPVARADGHAPPRTNG